MQNFLRAHRFAPQVYVWQHKVDNMGRTLQSLASPRTEKNEVVVETRSGNTKNLQDDRPLCLSCNPHGFVASQ